MTEASQPHNDFKLKEVFFKVNADGEYISFSPSAISRAAGNDAIKRSAERILGTSVAFENVSLDESVYVALHDRLVVQPTIAAMLAKLDEYAATIEADGRTISRVVISEAWANALPGLKERLAERDIALSATAYLPDSDSNSFYAISRPAGGFGIKE